MFSLLTIADDNENIAPICLPYESDEVDLKKTHHVSGWGVTKSSGMVVPINYRSIGLLF